MIRNYCLVTGSIISYFYVRAILTDYLKTIFLRCLIISRGVIGISCISFPYCGYIVTRNNMYVN